MKQRPILFKTEMVQAILSDRKTQTRRIIKPQPDTSDGRPLEVWYGWPSLARSGADYHNITPPFGRPGDVLYVKETWTELVEPHRTETEHYVYKADCKSADGEEIRQDYIKAGYPYKWKSSLYMPKDAARLFLEIVSIRAERLQNISEADAIAEGVYCYSQDDPEQTDYKNYLHKGDDDWGVPTAIKSYYTLWESINGKFSWDENPWVWVIEFKRIEKLAV